MKRIALFVVALCLNTGVMAATVWAPTNPNGDVNVLLTTFYPGNLGGGLLGLFDDANQSFSSPGLILNNNDTVMFTATGSGYNATNSAGSTTFLSNSYNFILGMSLDGGATWIGDTLTVDLAGANAYRAFFGGVGDMIVVDVKVVPVPAAFWLLSTAFIGLIGFSRRRLTSSTIIKV